MNDEKRKIKILSRCGEKRKINRKEFLEMQGYREKKVFMTKNGRKDAKIIINLRLKDREQ